jgi:hypothetical protein
VIGPAVPQAVIIESESRDRGRRVGFRASQALNPPARSGVLAPRRKHGSVETAELRRGATARARGAALSFAPPAYRRRELAASRLA